MTMLPSQNGGGVHGGGGPALRLDGVVRRYGDRTALDHVDLSVDAGQVLALLGPNGAGKTTLVSLAAGLSAPDAGTVRVVGIDPRADRRRTARLVGFAPQDIGIYPTISVRENLTFFGEATGLGRSEARARTAELAPLLRLDALLDRPAGQLSGGEQRRLHAAIALVHRPALILLDEPTAGADVQTRSALLALVRRLADDGAAVVYTTHYLPEVEELDAAVAVIDRGRIVSTGTVEALVAAHGQSQVVLTFDGPAPIVGGYPHRRDGNRVVVEVDDPGARLGGILAGLGGHAHGLVDVELVTPTLERTYLRLVDEPGRAAPGSPGSSGATGSPGSPGAFGDADGRTP